MPTTKGMMAAAVVGSLVLGAAIALLVEHTAFSKPDLRDAMQTIGVFDAWRISCAPRTEKKGGCLLQDPIVQQGTNTPVAEINIARRDSGDLLTVVVPLGVLVSPGVKLVIGDQTKTIPFKTCLQVGCVAALDLDSHLLDAMSHEKGGTITVTGRNAKDVSIAFSLAGFGDALAARAVDTKARQHGSRS